MANATITIKYVNEPKEGKSFGSVKDTAGQYWGVHSSKLGSLSPGQTINVTYETKEYNGKELRTIKSFQADAPRSTNGAKPPATNERMIFITGIVGRAMGSGNFSVSEISELTLAANEAYEELTGNNAGPQRQPQREPERRPVVSELDDEIPF